MVSNTQLKISSEEGIFIPLAAGTVLAIFAVFIGLAFDAANLNKTSSLLSNELDRICQSVVRQPGVQVLAAEKFKTKIEELEALDFLPSGSTITKAAMILPTMPQTTCFGFPGSCAGDNPVVDSTLTFGALGLAAGTFCENNCEFRGTTDSTGPDWKYPTTGFWDNLGNAGNTVGCEMEAEVERLIPALATLAGTSTVKVRSVWQKKIRGDFDPVTGDLVNTAPALSIIIDPTMTTRANDSRFWFMDGYFRPNINPLENFNSTNGMRHFGARQGGQFPDPISYPLANPVPPTLPFQLTGAYPVSPFCASVSGGNAQFKPPHPDACDDSDPSSPAVHRSAPAAFSAYDETQDHTYTFSDMENMLASCMNPAILVRNMLLATIVTNAARHGNARNMTEIMMTSVQNRFYEYEFPPASGNFIPANPNQHLPVYLQPPIKLVNFGEDLMQESYQIPFVGTYDTGFDDGVDIRSDQGSFLQPSIQTGYMNPFNLDESFDPGVQESMKKYHLMVQSQLRWCYHLYNGTLQAGPDGLVRHGVEGVHYLNDDLPLTLVNDGYEPNAVYDFIPELRSTSYPGPSKEWGQGDIWNTGAATEAGQRRLTAPELVSVLGAVESCPYEINLQNTGVANDKCTKPADQWSIPNDWELGTRDLRGDIVGALCHLAGNFNHSTLTNDPCPDNFPAIKSPGLFPLYDSDNPASQETQYPYGTIGANPDPNFYLPTAGHEKAAILIVFSNRLSVAELTAINALTGPNGPFVDQPITAIWIPTKSFADEESDYGKINNYIGKLKDAFNVPETSAPNDPTSNALYTITPFLSKYSLAHPDNTIPAADHAAFIADHPYAVGDESYRFRYFWTPG